MFLAIKNYKLREGAEDLEKTRKVESRAYQLVKPYHFEEVTIQHELMDGWVIVQPKLASICHADIRYYTGNRRKKALAEKLPMALLHEGIGEVIDSNYTELHEGQPVLIVPNIPSRMFHPIINNKTNEPKRIIADNYEKDSVFLGSGYDGVAQQFLSLPANNVVTVPEDIPENITVLSELCSISLNALKGVSPFVKYGKVGVFGDGPLGYVTAAMLHFVYKIPKENLVVFGAVKEKLAEFYFASTYLVQEYDFNQPNDIVTVLECTGGSFSKDAINQAIDLIESEGKIVLLGVTEEKVPINTRKVLEKGISISGNSRSTDQDFRDLMNYFQDESYQKALSKLLPSHYDEVSNVDELKHVFDDVAENNGWGKRVISFHW